MLGPGLRMRPGTDGGLERQISRNEGGRCMGPLSRSIAQRIVCKTQTSTVSGTKAGTRGGRKQTDGPEVPAAKPASKASQFYAFITGFPFPLGPVFQRKTCRYEVRDCTECNTASKVRGTHAAAAT